LAIILVATAPYLAVSTVPQRAPYMSLGRPRFAYSAFSASSIRGKMLPDGGRNVPIP
jgi:hypothetical protein